MSKLLIIRFDPSNPSVVSAAIIHSDDTTVELLSETTLEALKHVAYQYQTIVLVPTMLVTLLQATLPKARPSQLRKAVPYAVEEALTQDLSQLHFAISQARDNDQYTVAVVEHATIQSWLAECRHAEIQIQGMLPDVLCIPCAIGRISLFIESHQVLCRYEEQLGSVVERSNLFAAIHAALKDITPAIQGIDIYHTADNDFDITQFKAAFPELDIQSKEVDHPLHLMAVEALEASLKMNLCQGDYAIRRRPSWGNPWEWAQLGAISLLVLVILTQLAEWAVLVRRNQQLKQAITKQYQQVFPNAKAVSSPRIRFRRKLDHLQYRYRGNTWLQMMGPVASTLSKAKKIQLRHLDFNGSQLKLTLIANNFADLSQWQQALEREHLVFKKADAATTDGTVKADYIITREHK